MKNSDNKQFQYNLKGFQGIKRKKGKRLERLKIAFILKEKLKSK